MLESNNVVEATKKPAILFVCYANICRSPTAEAVFRQKARLAGLDCHIDSAGTHCARPGNAPDKRSLAVGQARGYDFSGIASRKVAANDFERFDYILPMDRSNVDSLVKIAGNRPDHLDLFLEYADDNVKSKVSEVPDPYLGGRRGFEIVLDIIELASDGLVQYIKNRPS